MKVTNPIAEASTAPTTWTSEFAASRTERAPRGPPSGGWPAGGSPGGVKVPVTSALYIGRSGSSFQAVNVGNGAEEDRRSRRYCAAEDGSARAAHVSRGGAESAASHRFAGPVHAAMRRA